VSTDLAGEPASQFRTVLTFASGTPLRARVFAIVGAIATTSDAPEYSGFSIREITKLRTLTKGPFPIIPELVADSGQRS
jgi:hypothetical protein